MSRRLPQALALILAAAFASGCTSEDSAPLPESAPPPPEEEPAELPPLADIVGAPVFEDLNPDPNILEVNLFAHWGTSELTPGKQTNVMMYNGSTPGPMLHARQGDRVIVHFHNQLGEPTTVHWHGLRISDEMDGNPRIMNPVEDGEEFTYDFVLPEAGTYWYHPHVNTIEQLERGLYGTIVVAEEEPPEFTAERIIVLDDVRLTQSGSIAPFQKISGMDVMHGRTGELLTNGSTEPIAANVPKGSIERWRLVNTSGARQMSLSLEGATMKVIGTDGGFLPQPYTIEDRLEITVGHRFELEVRFDGAPGSQVRLLSHVLALNENDQVVELPLPVAEYTIEGETEAVEPIYPAVELFPIDAGAPEQLIALGGVNTASGIAFTINGKSGMDVPDLVFQQGQPRVLRIKNELGMFHPFHLHGQWFQVLTRDGQPAGEPGLKDSVYVGGGEEVTIMTYFDNPGAWMYHCHIPEHAENGMMGHMIVEPSP